MSKFTTIIVVILGSLGTTHNAVNAQDTTKTVKYVNALDESIQLWFQPKGAPDFIRPPVAIGPKGEKSVPISTKFTGKRYIVMRDEAKRDTHIGWVDIESVATSQSPVLLIDGVTVTEVKEEVYTTKVPITRIVTGPDGQPKQIIEYQTEQRVGTKTVTMRVPKISISVNGQWEQIQPSTTPE